MTEEIRDETTGVPVQPDTPGGGGHPPECTGEQQKELSPEEFERFITESIKAAAERDHYLEQYKRMAAEYDNFRKRNARERESLYNDAVSDTVLRMLPVYDNLERALNQPTSDEPYRKGVEMIMKQFCDCLEKLGVSKIDASGQFDPELHEAISHFQDDALGENTIAEVFQQGFEINGKVIRHAMVRVAN